MYWKASVFTIETEMRAESREIPIQHPNSGKEKRGEKATEEEKAAAEKAEQQSALLRSSLQQNEDG